jgi:hypothetical protein
MQVTGATMAEIKFPKIEIDPSGLGRLENIVQRLEDAVKPMYGDGEVVPDNIAQLSNIIAKQQHEINALRKKYIKLLGFCHEWNIAYEKLYNELLEDDYDN